MRISESDRREKILRLLIDSDARKIIATTLDKAKSASEISDELSMPARTVYRHIGELCDSGLLTSERDIVINGGGKYSMYRSMVKTISVKYDSTDNLEIDLIPNENILYKFVRFWTYMGGG